MESILTFFLVFWITLFPISKQDMESIELCQMGNKTYSHMDRNVIICKDK